MATSHDIELAAVADATAVCQTFVQEAHDANQNAAGDAEREASAMAALIGASALSVVQNIAERKPWRVEANVATGAAMKLRADKIDEIAKNFENQAAVWENNTKKDPPPEEEFVTLSVQNAGIWKQLADRIRAIP